jgi:hypothetical protein
MNQDLMQMVQGMVTNPMTVILLLITVAAVAVLLKIQFTKDNFDLRSIIADDKGRPSIHKLGQLTALILSTWLLAYLAFHNQMTGEYFGTYMGVWAAAQAADKWLNNRRDDSSAPPGGGPQQ